MTPLTHYRAVSDARDKGELLIYIQAVDEASDGSELTPNEYLLALRTVSMTKTGKRMGLFPCYKGMEVRLTAKMNAKRGLVQDAVGLVVDIIFHPEEFKDDPDDNWFLDPTHAVWTRGVVCLKRLPLAVLVEFPHLDEDLGFGRGPNGGGILAVEPSFASWEDGLVSRDRTIDGFDNTKKRTIPMRRCGFPLASARERTVQTSQGILYFKRVME